MDIAGALRTGATQTLLDRVVARVTGDDPVAFLDATTTQDLTDLKPGRSALTCMLDEKGHVLAEMRATALSDGGVLIDSEQAARDAILGWLATVAPLSACEVGDESARWTITAVRGAKAADALASFGRLTDETTEHDGTVVVPVTWGVAGYDVLAPAQPAIDAARASAEELDAARIASGRPRYGIDVDASAHIAETPLIARAVSFTKGCYPGQESVARVHNLGRVRRRLVGLDLTGSVVPARGTLVRADGMEVGSVTSAAIFESEVAALAWLRSDVHDGATVDVAGSPGIPRAL
ncbi:MAG: CAF17-like 4Fe-4S cluster assembly/insertion protein YgfZ [Actinomycetota bacterium]